MALLIVGMVLGVALAMLVHVPARWQHVRAVRAGARYPVQRTHDLLAVPRTARGNWLYGCDGALVLTVPLSIGGWGLREASMVGLFALVGVPPAVSLSLSILSGLLATLVTLPGALVRLR